MSDKAPRYGKEAVAEMPERGKVKVPVQSLPKTEAPKSHQEARKNAISKALKKAQSKNKDASISKTEQSPAEEYGEAASALKAHPKFDAYQKMRSGTK